jgi:hypothetical protein
MNKTTLLLLAAVAVYFYMKRRPGGSSSSSHAATVPLVAEGIRVGGGWEGRGIADGPRRRG